MTDNVSVDVKIGPANRVVVPAEVREFLNVGQGDRIEFVLSGDEVRVITPRSRLEAIWAKNHGGDTGDATADIRDARIDEDAQRDAKWDRIEARVAHDHRTEDEITTDLFTALRLA